MGENEKEHKFREVIERYCSVIGKNTAMFKISTDDAVSYQCLQRPECESVHGGCKNEKYGK